MDFVQRNKEIVALKDCGQSYSNIAIKFCISPSRVKEIYKREKQHILSEKAHIDAINGDNVYTFYDAVLEVCDTKSQATRVFRCLDRAGILREIETNNGSLDSYSDETLLAIRSFGQTSLKFARKANILYKQNTKRTIDIQKGRKMENRICIKCNKKLNSKTRPTTYSISKYPRLGAPKYLYLCAKCANDEAPILKTLIEDYLSAI